MTEKVFDVKVLNAFLAGTVNVLTTMCQTNPLTGKPSLKKSKALTGDVSGAISLTGTGMRGVFIITFSRGAILLIVSRMLGERYAGITDEIKDAVGELTNMIAGNSRKELAQIGMPFEAGIPTIVVGVNHSVYMKVSESAPVITIPFTVDGGFAFSVEFTFEQVK